MSSSSEHDSEGWSVVMNLIREGLPFISKYGTWLQVSFACHSLVSAIKHERETKDAYKSNKKLRSSVPTSSVGRCSVDGVGVMWPFSAAPDVPCRVLEDYQKTVNEVTHDILDSVVSRVEAEVPQTFVSWLDHALRTRERGNLYDWSYQGLRSRDEFGILWGLEEAPPASPAVVEDFYRRPIFNDNVVKLSDPIELPILLFKLHYGHTESLAAQQRCHFCPTNIDDWKLQCDYYNAVFDHVFDDGSHVFRDEVGLQWKVPTGREAEKTLLKIPPVMPDLVLKDAEEKKTAVPSRRKNVS